jgi:hypothetical protein
MDNKHYTFSQIKEMKVTPFTLPQYVLDAVAFLNKSVIIPQNTVIDNTVVKKKGYDKNSKNYKSENPVENSWTMEKENFAATNIFKVTKIETKVGVDKDINEIRISLNKISNKNYDTQKNIILEHMTRIDDDDSLYKIAQFIFDIASSNKFYSELYADLYQELITKSIVFKTILDSFVSTYKNTIDTIKYVDSNIDYDGYCSYVKDNDKRRAMATFFMMLLARNILETQTIHSIIVHFQTTLFQYLEFEGRSLECEEISEIIFIFVSIGNSNLILTNQDVWNNNVIPNVLQITKYKVKEHLSLTSRIVFKHLDLKDFLSKNSTK